MRLTGQNVGLLEDYAQHERFLVLGAGAKEGFTTSRKRNDGVLGADGLFVLPGGVKFLSAKQKARMEKLKEFCMKPFKRLFTRKFSYATKMSILALLPVSLVYSCGVETNIVAELKNGRHRIHGCRNGFHLSGRGERQYGFGQRGTTPPRAECLQEAFGCVARG